MKKGQKLKVEKPKQYQQGWTEFYKLKFFLTPDSLIPRPETELLVDEIIKIKPSTVLDLGTGSGNIAVAVAKNLPETKILATDVSDKALEVARKNAKFHKVEDQIFFEIRDLLDGMQKAPDVIVTNLPYIPTARLMHIDPMVTEWEPKVALDGGIDGFELYRKLFAQIVEKKLFPKYLLGEIDYSHADFVYQESRKFFPQAKAEVKQDLAKKQRYFVIKF
jgi:release factor glutamine methyltransferase